VASGLSRGIQTILVEFGRVGCLDLRPTDIDFLNFREAYSAHRTHLGRWLDIKFWKPRIDRVILLVI